MSQPITRAVVLAAGRGTRMRRPDPDARLTEAQARVADTGIKTMIPIGSRPFLDYVLGALAEAGMEEVCLVIGPEHDVIRDRYTKDLASSRLTVSIAVQHEARGSADALLAAEPFVDAAPFLAVNSDNYYPVDVLRAMAAGGEPAVAGFDRAALLAGGRVPAARLLAWSLLEVDAQGYLVHVMEKPDADAAHASGDHVLVGMNCWAFRPPILEACRRVTPSARGELELPVAVNLAIDDCGERIRVRRFSLPVLDLSTRADVAGVAEALAGTVVRL